MVWWSAANILIWCSLKICFSFLFHNFSIAGGMCANRVERNQTYDHLGFFPFNCLHITKTKEERQHDPKTVCNAHNSEVFILFFMKNTLSVLVIYSPVWFKEWRGRSCNGVQCVYPKIFFWKLPDTECNLEHSEDKGIPQVCSASSNINRVHTSR